MSSPSALRRAAPRTAVQVRPASVRDHSAIHGVVTAAYQQYEAPIGALLYRRYLADLLDLDHHARHGQLIVAEVDGVIRGSAAFYPDSSVQGLGWPSGWAGGRALSVHPGARRHGVAQALLATCERLAREAQAPVFAFHTASVMIGAIALYEHLGYRRAPDFDRDLAAHFAVVDGPHVLALAYRRDLPDPDLLRAWGLHEPLARITLVPDTTPQTETHMRNAS